MLLVPVLWPVVSPDSSTSQDQNPKLEMVKYAFIFLIIIIFALHVHILSSLQCYFQEGEPKKKLKRHCIHK